MNPLHRAWRWSGIGFIYLLLLTSLAWGQADSEAENTPQALPDALQLSDGWWGALSAGEGEVTDAQKLLRWQDRLHGKVAEASAEELTELNALLSNLSELIKAPTIEQDSHSEATAPGTLSELLALVARQDELGKMLEADAARARYNRSLMLEVEVRLNQVRQEYIQTALEDPERRRLGWRWMRLRVRQQLTDHRAREVAAGQESLRASYDQLVQLLATPIAQLTHDEKEQTLWRKQVQRLSAAAQEGFDAIRPSLDPPLAELVAATRSRAVHVELAIAQLALWITEHSIDQNLPPPVIATDRIGAIHLWRDEAKNLLSNWRARTLADVEYAAAEQSNTSKLKSQFDAIRDLNNALSILDIGLAQYQLLSRHVNLQGEWSWDAIGALWSLNAQKLSAATRSVLNRTLFHINQSPVTGGGLLRMLLIIIAAFVISTVIRRGLERLERRSNLSASIAFMFNRVLHYTLVLLGFLIALSSIGIDLTKFALFASALGVGLGFGLQAVISNFVSGLIILFERSLKIGDFVELESGVRGHVREINVRGTVITTNDNIDILVPNSEFVSGKVTNWTLRDTVRRLRIPFGVAYGSDKELVKKAVLEAAESVPFTLNGNNYRTQVWLTEFGDSSLNFKLIVWISGDAVSRPSGVEAAYLWAIETALEKYEIEIPFPQTDLHLRSYFGLSGQAAIDAIAGKKLTTVDNNEEQDQMSQQERKQLSSNDAAEDTLRAIAQEQLEHQRTKGAEDDTAEEESDTKKHD